MDTPFEESAIVEAPVEANGDSTPPPPPTMDVKLSIVIGDNMTVELVKNRLADGAPEAVALLASKSLCPIGREAQVLIPDKSPMDNKLLATFKSVGRKEFGEVIEMETDGLLGHRLILGVSPRDTLRRDETKEILMRIIFSQLRVGLQSSAVVHFEATDGNTIFSIPRAQIAEVLFDACWYFGNRFPAKRALIRFSSTSKTLLEQYAKVFLKRYEKLTTDLLEAGPMSEENPPSNFMIDFFQDDSDWIKLYGMHQKQVYNDCGSAVGVELYDAFVACEKRFGRPKSPVHLGQVKAYLREIQNATDMQISAIVQRRQKECQKVVIEAFEKHKATPMEFFRSLCVYNLQFCKEILVKTIKEITSLDNLFLPPSQLAKMLHRYAGEDSAGDDGEGGASTNGDSSNRVGATRTASDIYIAKNSKMGKRASTGRSTKRKGSTRGGMAPGAAAAAGGAAAAATAAAPNSTLQHSSSSGDVSPTAGNGSASPTAAAQAAASGEDSMNMMDQQNQVDPYQVARDRIGKDALRNWNLVMDVLYAGNNKVVNMAFDITQTADADKLAAALVRIFHYNDDALNLLRLAIKNEVDKTPVLSTLFRQNSMASKMLTTFSRLVSKNYLVSILSPCIQKVVEAGDALEVDPSKLKQGADIKANQALLKEITDILITDICKSVDMLPYPCRAICNILKEAVEPKFPDGANVAIAGFLVLRLINPALVVPDADGLNILSKEKTAEARRGLLFVSKLIQNLANQVDFKKEEFMITFNSFVSEKFALMEDFFLECASPCDPKESDKNSPLDITPALFNESLQVVSKQFSYTKDKYLSLLDMEADVIDDFKALLENPLDENASSSTATTTAPMQLSASSKDLSAKDSKKEKEKDKKEKDKDKKDKEKAKEEKDKAKKEEKDKKEKEKEKKKEEKEKEKKDKK